MANEQDLNQLRRAIALAQTARDNGQDPFGAVLLGADGTLLAEARNTVQAEQDITAHAEVNALRAAGRAHGLEALAGATLYASTEPCAMCAGAAFAAGVGRVVFGLREADLPRARGGPLPWVPVQLPCAEVAARGRRAMAVEGPLLAEQAALPHQGLSAT